MGLVVLCSLRVVVLWEPSHPYFSKIILLLLILYMAAVQCTSMVPVPVRLLVVHGVEIVLLLV